LEAEYRLACLCIGGGEGEEQRGKKSESVVMMILRNKGRIKEEKKNHLGRDAFKRWGWGAVEEGKGKGGAT